MVNVCQTTLIKMDVSLARVAELSKKKLETVEFLCGFELQLFSDKL